MDTRRECPCIEERRSFRVYRCRLTAWRLIVFWLGSGTRTPSLALPTTSTATLLGSPPCSPDPPSRHSAGPGDVVLDPFMGGATTLVECRALGRHAAGNDVSSLSVFLARPKATPLSDADVPAWWIGYGVTEHLNLHLPPIRAIDWHRIGCPAKPAVADSQDNRTRPRPSRWPVKPPAAAVRRVPAPKAGQWALDCRSRVPTAEEFRVQVVRVP